MKMYFKNAKLYKNGSFTSADAMFDGDCFNILDHGINDTDIATSRVFYNCYILPGFCDVHVHFREPGYLYKEDTASGSAAAAHGGYTAVCTMPNLDPTPDSKENLKVQLDAIEQKATIAVLPFGTITKGEKGEKLADIEDIANDVVGFSDDGRGVQSEQMMLDAMRKVKSVGKIISAHCEDNSLLRGGYIHDGEYAKEHGHRGICSESEWGPIARDIELVKKTGCPYHVCHISTKESVDLIRKAKAEGVDITCETGPHYLVLDDSALIEDARFKMNPPLRSKEDREALVEGIKDGTIDMIATDHAPHSAEEKSRGLEKSLMGVVGLETAFAVLYTDLVKTGVITMEKLVELMSKNPRERFDVDTDVGFTVFSCEDEYEIDPEQFLTKGRSTPFMGKKVFGECLLTVYNGKAVYIKE
ncbi:MAG: dihydroorotase [Ruminococcaceae bacterium]|nr:dihydroorotase [Oscillospiraceae bacterium]